MTRKAQRSGVSALGRDRIKFDFEFEGKRYRPSIKRAPSEGNLERAQKQLQGIRERIARGSFSFADEFPKYRLIKAIDKPIECAPKLCNDVFDRFIKHCEARYARKDLAYATLYGYQNVLNDVWRPHLGHREFESVRYTDLAQVADSRTWSKKRYNNAVSVVRCAFEFGYRDLPEKRNPAEAMKTLRITKKDRKQVDPFTTAEAETVIAALHADWGEATGNYDEFRFFTGLRPSEEIALTVADCDLVKGTVSITKARVLNRDKDRTKTNEDRVVELCPRALEVLKRQLVLRDRLKAAGLLRHEKVFCKENGGEIINLQFGYERWKKTLTESVTVRYREPYNARHSCVTWNLMTGKNLLWVSKQHGHGVQVMLAVYAAWLEGGGEAEIEAIKKAMAGAPAALRKIIGSESENVAPEIPVKPPELAIGWQYEGRPKRNCLKKQRNRANSVRAFDPYTLSRGAPSTTRPSLRLLL